MDLLAGSAERISVVSVKRLCPVNRDHHAKWTKWLIKALIGDAESWYGTGPVSATNQDFASQNVLERDF
jgi:hypothetical protein